MATVKEMFVNCIQDGIKAAKTISDPNHKAIAYAELAKALAMTNLVGGGSAVNVEAPVEAETQAPAEEPKAKESLKTPAPKGNKKGQLPAKEEKPVEPTEPELTEEWTEEMVELKAEAIAKMQEFKESFGEEAVEQCVGMFSEGQYSSLEDINPLNIDAFVAFMEALAAEQAGE